MSFAAADSIIAAERALLAAMDELRVAKQRLSALASDPTLTDTERSIALVGGCRAGNLTVGVETLLASIADLCQGAGEVEARAEMTYTCN
jgi:hypothetical protein